VLECPLRAAQARVVDGGARDGQAADDGAAVAERRVTEADNARHWDPARKGVYEVWYLTWNHPTTDQGFWLRFITEAPLEGPARGELWFARFDPRDARRTFGIHARFPQVVAQASPFELRIGGSRLGHDRTAGRLAGDGHDVQWDLRWVAAPRTNQMMPSLIYLRGGLGETTAHSPNPRVPLSGTLRVDGEELAFEDAIAGQTHLWGRKHAYSWTWVRCAELGDSDAVLEMLGVRLQRRGVMLPPLVLASLDLDGEHHRFNQFRHVAANRGTWRVGETRFSAWSPAIKLEAELVCRPDQMVNAPYLDPDGTEVWCANTEIGDARLTIWKRSGLRWRMHRRLEGPRRAHFEIGGRVRDASVTREHRLIAD
jgi:hypothetical protein